MSSKKLLIVLSSGEEDGGKKATLAFAMGIASLYNNITTSIFLTGDGTIWGIKNKSSDVNTNGFDSLSDYIKKFTSLDGKLLICTACVNAYSPDNSKLKEAVIPETEFCGFTAVTSLAVESSVISL